MLTHAMYWPQQFPAFFTTQSVAVPQESSLARGAILAYSEQQPHPQNDKMSGPNKKGHSADVFFGGHSVTEDARIRNRCGCRLSVCETAPDILTSQSAGARGHLDEGWKL